MILFLDRTRKNLAVQVSDQIRCLIEKGVLKSGSLLPSTRFLAESHDLNRATVLKAYQMLQCLGLIEKRNKSRFRVVKQKLVFCANQGICLHNWDKLSTAAASSIFLKYISYRHRQKINDVIDLLRLEIDENLIPYDDFRSCMSYPLTGKISCGEYVSSHGYEPLRTALALRLSQTGISVSEQEIIITEGTTSALDLLLRTFKPLNAGLEHPVYGNIFNLFTLHGHQMFNYESGYALSKDSLIRSFSENRIGLFYAIPSFQNPTGKSLTCFERENLYQACVKCSVVLIEDGFEEEFRNTGNYERPVKSLDRSGSVVFLSSFSKILFPGIRIGFMAADRILCERLAALKKVTMLSGDVVMQCALEKFISRGYLDRHVRKMRRTIRRRTEIAVEALQNSSSGLFSFEIPSGGYLIWLKLDNRVIRPRRIMEEALLKNGVMAASGEYFFNDSQGSDYLRLSISHCPEHQISEGISRVIKTLESFRKEES